MKTKSATKDFPVVCLSGSAGGLDAYTRLLQHLPADMGVAIVIVNHLRTVATRLHEILPHYTQMPVELITERLDIQPTEARHSFTTRYAKECNSKRMYRFYSFT
jgi:two-component system chemotaxis response regulator CheB